VEQPSDAFVVDPSVPVIGIVPVDPLEPSSAAWIAWASIAALLLLLVVGYGWAGIGLEDPITAVAAAPAIGAAMLILVATALDALGVPLGTTAGPVAASVLAGGGGYVVRFVLERRAGTETTPEVQEQPAE
jgi:hypothetical protein